MTSKIKPLPETEVSCKNCKACCCRQDAMLFNDPQVSEEFIERNSLGEWSMARLKDGWCAALDRNTMMCTIYEIRPWICREFAEGESECLEARADYL